MPNYDSPPPGKVRIVPNSTRVNSTDAKILLALAATDADDLYRIAGRILDVGGVERTSTALVMRQLVDYRVGPLLRRAAEANT